MDERMKAKWVKALRSGKYPQGKGLLRNTKGEYCCLGVLVELCGFYVYDEKTETYTRGKDTRQSKSMTHNIFIDKNYLNYDIQNVLARMNDDNNNSFIHIADFIEKTDLSTLSINRETSDI